MIEKGPWKIECFLEDLFLGSQWSIILGYRRLSVKFSFLLVVVNGYLVSVSLFFHIFVVAVGLFFNIILRLSSLSFSFPFYFSAGQVSYKLQLFSSHTQLFSFKIISLGLCVKDKYYFYKN